MVIFIILWLGFCLLVGLIGMGRKIGFAGSFLASLILSPILGLLITALFAEKEVK